MKAGGDLAVPSKEATSSAAGGTALAAVCLLATTWLLARGAYFTFSLCPFGICSGGQNRWLGSGLLGLGLSILVFGLVAAPEWAGSSHVSGRGVAALPAALAVGLVLARADLGANASLFLMIATAVAVLAPPRTVYWFVALGVGLVIASSVGDVSLPAINFALAPLVVAAGIKPRPRFRMEEWRPAPGLTLRPLTAVVRQPSRRR